MVLLGAVTGSTGVIVSVVNAMMAFSYVPRSIPLAATAAALSLMAWPRAAYRCLKELPAERSQAAGDEERVVVFGAGQGGRQLVRSMLKDASSLWHPVGFLDDDPRLRHQRTYGVAVLGGLSDLASIAARTRATTLVIAIPSARSEIVRGISESATAAGLAVKVLPGVSELFDRRVGIDDLRDMDVTDLLGRHQIDTDIDTIAGYLTGRRILVTGAGGSIGSELCRQIHRFAPSELIMLDRDESALHAVQLSIHGRALLDSPEVVLGDIRDAKFLAALFAERRPDVVFHAAALKHLPMLEQYPGEAVKTNVWGTLAVLEAAAATGVDRFVNVSTDKAADPCSALGYSKRIAEGLTSAAAERSTGTYLSVRFGNVLGSRGSVLTSFTAQIAAGGPVTVTDPDVTRYFMTIQEACQLLIQAAAIGHNGEALVLDMGEPVRILDVAEQLIALDGGRVEVVFTGLRAGEKMHEALLGDGEPDIRPVHPLVSHVSVPAVPSADVLRMDPWAGDASVSAALDGICRWMVLSPLPAQQRRRPTDVGIRVSTQHGAA
jgi:FlaA1/EpsC-like NDP-sugar epimerase